MILASERAATILIQKRNLQHNKKNECEFRHLKFKVYISKLQFDVLVLKLDDFASRSGSPNENWQRVVDYLEAQNTPASFGMIGKDIQRANPEFCEWIRAKQETGLIEFWNHGKTHGKIEKDGKKIAEFQDSLATQIEILWSTASVSEACEALETFIDYGYDTEEFNISAHYLFHENGEYKKREY